LQNAKSIALTLLQGGKQAMFSKWLKGVSMLAVVGLLVSGCATTSQQGNTQATSAGSSSDQKRTRVEGAGIGALVGGVLGYALGGKNKAKGALIGAALGAGAGYLVGNEVAKRKQKYASEEEFLDAEIQNATEFNRVARDYNERLRVQIAELDEASMALKSKYKAGAASQQDLENKRAEVQTELARSEKFYDQLKKEYDIKMAVYQEQQKKRPQDDAYLAKLEKEVLELKNNLEQLSAESKQLASIDERLTI
jgi:hypothetical protein